MLISLVGNLWEILIKNLGTWGIGVVYTRKMKSENYLSRVIDSDINKFSTGFFDNC